jgi:4-diphosphocytidyl-2-C-methyl-D-erythritol kinase
MVMQTVTLSDRITIEENGTDFTQVFTNLKYLPKDDRNLAAAAAAAFWRETGLKSRGLNITIQKVIPVCAGMAGGSADGAAVLRSLNQICAAGLSKMELARIGESVGSDVPYCVCEGTMLAEGRGERLTALPPLPDCCILLCKPDFSISTPELFSRIDSVKIRCRPDTTGAIEALRAGDLGGVARRIFNVFEQVLPPRQAAIVQDVKQTLIGCGALGGGMSGTGPTVFGLFERRAAAEDAFHALSAHYPSVWMVNCYQPD